MAYFICRVEKGGDVMENRTDAARKRKESGRRAEDAVLSLFLAKGYSLLARNYCVHNAGELDLILSRGMCIYIVEVKCRSERNSFGGAAAAITGQKKLKMIRTARVFLQRREWQQYDVRFLAGCVTHREGIIIGIEILPM